MDHIPSLELKETPMWPAACPVQGDCFVFCHIDLQVLKSWNMPEKVTAERPFCRDLVMAVPRPNRTTMIHYLVYQGATVTPMPTSSSCTTH